MNIVLLLLLSLATCSTVRRSGAATVLFFDFELYCLKYYPLWQLAVTDRYAVDRAVMSIRISKSRTSPPASPPPLLQVVLETTAGRTPLRHVYPVPQWLGPLDLVLPPWAMRPGVLTRVILENARTGSVVSGDLDVEFRRECKWPQPPSDEQDWVMNVSGGRGDGSSGMDLDAAANHWF